MKVEFLSPEEVQNDPRGSRIRKAAAARTVPDPIPIGPKPLNFVSAKEGLTALNRFLNREGDYEDLHPFILPVKYSEFGSKGSYCFRYYLNHSRVDGTNRNLVFYLSHDQTTNLDRNIYAVPHSDATRGQKPYYWLDLQADPAVDSHPLSTCRLRPEADSHQIDFKTWHGLEEQLLSDYIWGINLLRFADLSPFTLVVKNSATFYYHIAGRFPSFNLGGNSMIQDGDTLKVIPRTDNQKLYEWIDVVKTDKDLPETRWPLVCSYRLLAQEHKINSINWFGLERQLLKDFIEGKTHIKFEDLKPMRIIATNSEKISLFEVSDKSLLARLSCTPGLLAPEEELIAIPKQDDQKIYQWLELYRFDPITNGPVGEILASGRITSKGINQKDWLGVKRQLLKDYSEGLVKFEQLTPTPFKAGARNIIYLWKDNHDPVVLVYSLRFHLAHNDSLTLMPEKETEKGTDFLLTKDGIKLARYRLNLKTKKFTCIDVLVDKPSNTESSNTSISSEEAEETFKRVMGI